MNEIDNCGAQVKEKKWNCCGKQLKGYVVVVVAVSKYLFMITGHKMHELAS